jgi:hypothetical protein
VRALAGLLALAVLVLSACGAPETSFRDGSPLDALPDHITPLVDLGPVVRPAWSADGRRFLYLDALVGDVFEHDLETGTSRPRTKHFAHHGFTRAHYLANGDLLLCGPSQVDPDDPVRGRWHADFWLLDAAGDEPAQPLGERCFEGPAVSRRSMRIAWVRTDVPDKILTARSEIWTGLVDPNDGKPRLVEARRLVGRSDFYGLGMLEPQDFRPPDERELLFSAYAWRGGEAMGIDLETGEIRNYSRSRWYDEIEGVTPGRTSCARRAGVHDGHAARGRDRPLAPAARRLGRECTHDELQRVPRLRRQQPGRPPRLPIDALRAPPGRRRRRQQRRAPRLRPREVAALAAGSLRRRRGPFAQDASAASLVGSPLTRA